MLGFFVLARAYQAIKASFYAFGSSSFIHTCTASVSIIGEGLLPLRQKTTVSDSSMTDTMLASFIISCMKFLIIRLCNNL